MQSLKKFESKKLSTTAARDVMGESSKWCGTPQSGANYIVGWNGAASGLNCGIATTNCALLYNNSGLFPNGSQYKGNVKIVNSGLFIHCYYEYPQDDFPCTGSLIWC